MSRDLSRMFSPKSIAVVGGGDWCRALIAQCHKIGFAGALWPVHPAHDRIAGVRAYRSVSDLPTAPDATFVGVNRNATVDIVAELATMEAGGAVCFASGYLEASAEDEQGVDLQAKLLRAAADMPILGPNCYGFINYLDNALLWPDQHGGQTCKSGVAIITQSSNMAINLTMQRRGLPLAFVVTAGNQAQTGMAEIGAHLLADPRVTALGLYIEGFGDLRRFEALADAARKFGKPVVAIKAGRSEQARAATVSHTASLAGGDAGASALLARLGIARAGSLPEFLETLKLLHVAGPLASNRLASVSCSGGEASMVADTAIGFDVEFPALNPRQARDLRAALGPMVALANPLDYHTYIWRDPDAMAAAWGAIMDPTIALTLIIVDFPRGDRADPTDWDCAIKAAIAARNTTGAKVAMVATLPELMPEDVADRLLAAGVVPLCGLNEALGAAAAAAWLGQDRVPSRALVLPGQAEGTPETVNEARAKSALAAHGVETPRGLPASSPKQAGTVAAQIGFPVVLKGEGAAHKTEAGAVVLGLTTATDVAAAAATMTTRTFLVEEMITGAVAEMLIGVTRDPAHGLVLTIGAGGVLAELLVDTASVLVPSDREAVRAAILGLRVARLLKGYRGGPGADIGVVVDAVMAVQAFVVANATGLEEVEINPLIVTPSRAVAADALWRQRPH